MLLSECLEQPTGTPYVTEVMTVSAELRDKKAGGKFLCLTVQDESTTVTLNQWAGYGEAIANFTVGTILEISGSAGKPYNDKPQLNLDFARKIAESITDYEGDKTFVPRYEVNEEHKNYILNSIMQLSNPWKRLAIDMFDLVPNGAGFRTGKRWDAFLSAPAAKKWHGNKVGGLIHHTIGVVKSVKSIMSNYPDSDIDRDRVIFCALIHDLFKTKDYVWAPVIDYNAETLVDHRYAVVAELVAVNDRLGQPLVYSELQKVLYMLLCHHGTYGEQPCKSSEDWILHLADMIDSKIVAGDEGK
jgi:3'-5' exoribonuclease